MFKKEYQDSFRAFKVFLNALRVKTGIGKKIKNGIYKDFHSLTNTVPCVKRFPAV